MTRLAIVDYGMGNLRSISKALEGKGAEVVILNFQQDNFEKEIKNSNGVVIPGVGAFKDAMKNLDRVKAPLLNVLESGMPALGVCLGFQLFFTDSAEGSPPLHKGLNLLKGHVIRFPHEMIVPHMGWNSINIVNRECTLLQDIPDGAYFYFVHSYYAVPTDTKNIIATTRYDEVDFPSIVQKDALIATQFHPEKSSELGLKILQNFIHFCKN